MTLLIDRARSLLDHVRVGEAGPRVTGRLTWLSPETMRAPAPIGRGKPVASSISPS